jgi:hypothetical protein
MKAPIEVGSLEQRSMSVSVCLWLHLQKNLLKKSTPSLQAFITRKAETVTQSDSDELLDRANGDDDDDDNEKNGLINEDPPPYDGSAA